MRVPARQDPAGDPWRRPGAAAPGPSAAAAATVPPAGPLDDMIACPRCDALYRVEVPGDGERAVCRRCHTVLIAPRRGAFLHIVLLGIATAILMLGAVFFPFLKLRVAGLTHATSVWDSALAFAGGPMLALAVATAALIVLVPVLRVLLLVYVLAPLVLGRRALPRAADAFGFADALKPWSMAEVFAIGTAVALVKITDLAHVEFGAAFWMFAGFVAVTVLQDELMDRWSVWNALEAAR